jgi:hypothetical protein
MRFRFSVERKKEEEDILMGAKELLYCRPWVRLAMLQKRGQTRLHATLPSSMSGWTWWWMLLLETTEVHTEPRHCPLKERLKGYHKVSSDQYCEW